MLIGGVGVSEGEGNVGEEGVCEGVLRGGDCEVVGIVVLGGDDPVEGGVGARMAGVVGLIRRACEGSRIGGAGCVDLHKVSVDGPGADRERGGCWRSWWGRAAAEDGLE